MIAYLGTGLLGANFVRAFRERGEDVQVWNRTSAKAKALEEYGARAFEDPAEAVRGATRVHITQSDDAAVDALMERAAAGFSKDVMVVDHTTTSPPITAERVQRWNSRGVKFIHAPVFMGPPNALNGSGVMLISGDETIYKAVEPALAKMTGKLVYLGSEVDRAAKIKLLGNHLIVLISAGLGDTVALARAFGLPAEDVSQLFDYFNFSTMMPGRLNRLLQEDYDNPTWTLRMARKDVRLMQESGAKLPVVDGVSKAMDALIAQGHGEQDYSILARRFGS